MKDIDKLIKLNLEMEGLLRTLQSRDSRQAEDLLLQKANEYLAGIVEAPGQNSNVTKTEPDVVTPPVAKRDATQHDETEQDEIKDEEAEDSEVAPEGELAEEAVAEEEKKGVVVNEKLSKAFTLNDRFRFKRELFNGNDEDFTATIQLLSEMESYPEAEDYLLNDMMWDKNDPSVADFLLIIAANIPDGRR